MNILQQEDIIKGLPDQALQEEAKSPSGQVPQFLVVSEIQRRTDMRSKYKDPNQQQPQGTIADQITQEGIASVQPQQQQPQQGQPPQGQPMQMRGGGMTPFMRKYAGGGVVRMQEGGITPNEMLQMDSQMMAQKYPFLSGSRDEILQGLSGIDPNDASSISAMFGGAPEIDGVLQQVSNRNNAVNQEQKKILSGGLGPAPMVENITAPSLLELDGVMTTTPDGIRPNSGNPSVGSLDSFSNAFREDAERAKNLLATLDDSTPQEKEAISNPVSVNLPRIRTLEEIGKEAPQMLPLSANKEDKSLSQSMSDIYSGFSGSTPGRSEALLDSLDVKPIDNPSSPYEMGQDLSSAAKTMLPFGDAYRSSYNAIADIGEPFVDFGRGVAGADEQGKGFRYDTDRGLFQQDDSEKTFYFGGIDSKSNNVTSSNTAGEGTVLRKPEGAGTVLKKSSGPYIPQLANSNLLDSLKNTSVGTDNSRVGPKTEKEQLKAAEKGASLLDKLLGLGLEGEKKQAYAMALMALGKGISDGDTAGGLQNAGLAMNAMQEQNANRRDKALDREVTSNYYKDKLAESRSAQNIRIQSAVESAMTEWNNANMGATPEQQETKRQELLKRFQLLGDTTSTGSDINNQRSAANISFDKNGNRI